MANEGRQAASHTNRPVCETSAEVAMARKLLVAILVLLFPAFSASHVAAGDSPSIKPTSAAEPVQVSTTESLEVIALDRTLYFITADGTDAVAHPGLYEVQVAAPGSLRLKPANSSNALLVQALTIDHRKEIAEPVALSIRDGEDRHHVVLLLPDGQALDAVASYSAVRPRGWNPASVVVELIEKAFAEKPRPIRKDEKQGGH